MPVKQEIRNKYKRLFLVNQKLRNLCKELIDAQPKVTSLKDGVACHMLAKAYKTHGVATHLAKNGYSEDADMLIRTMFDCALIISACLLDPSDDTAQKYFHFDDSTRAKMYSVLKERDGYKKLFDERAKNPKIGDEPIEEIQKRADQWTKDYGGDFRQKWHSGQTTGVVAESVNLKDYFQTAFSLQSQLSHALPRTADLYFSEKGNDLLMDVEAHERGVDLSIVSGFNMMIVIMEHFNSRFKIIDAHRFKEIVDEYTNAVKEK